MMPTLLLTASSTAPGAAATQAKVTTPPSALWDRRPTVAAVERVHPAPTAWLRMRRQPCPLATQSLKSSTTSADCVCVTSRV